MTRWQVGGLVMVLGLASAQAQGIDHTDLQLHGFAVQSFVYGGPNNYLGLNSSAGSAHWTEAAVNINDQVSENYA